MSVARKLKRKSFYIDEQILRRAKKALGLTVDAEVIRASLETVAEMEEFDRFIKRTSGSLKPGSFGPI